jgi:hypothetical protein
LIDASSESLGSTEQDRFYICGLGFVDDVLGEEAIERGELVC